MPRIKKAVEEVLEEVKEEVVQDSELQELLAIHKSLTDKGIRDIGQLEVLISRLQ